MVKELYSFEDALFMSLYYNGYEDFTLELIDYISDVKNEMNSIIRPDFINDPIQELVWMVLVIKFGDYGTSPRSGWINLANRDLVVAILQSNYQMHMSPV